MKKWFALLLCLCLLSTPVLASGEASGGASREAVSMDGASVTVDEAYFDGTVTDNGVRDFTVSAANEQVIGLSVSGGTSDDPVVIENGRVELSRRGTGIALTGGNAVIDNVVVWNKATEGVSASGSAVATLKNVVVYGEQDIATYRRVSPFALGLAGSMRVTNAVGQSQVTYEDSVIVSGSWAPLSTDAGQGVTLTTRNVLAGVGWLEIAEDGKEYTATKEVGGVTYGFTLGDSAHYNSGYVSYCDSGFHNYYYDSEFYGTDYVIILSSSVSSATMVNDKCYSDRIGLMWHKNQGGTVDITGGSLYADRCLFMMKGYSDLDTDGCYANLTVDGTELAVGEENVLLQLMTSDDCGLNYEALQVPAVEDDFSQVECLLGTMVQKTYSEGFPPTIMYVFDVNGEEIGVSKADYDAFVSEHPDAKPVMVEYEPQKDCTAAFKNLSVEGDVYNAAWQAYQGLDVTFDNAEITGVISSAWARHVDADGNALPGGTVIPADSSLDCHLGIGRVKNTAAPTVNNPVYLTLQNGAVWNVTGESYLAKLTVDGAEIRGTVTVDGAAVDVSAGGSWEGEIVVTPAAGGEVTWADFQAWLMEILPDVCPFPDAVGEIIMATGSWDEIDIEGNGPWGKIFGEDAYHATTFDEFVANGGVGTYNADFVDLPAEDAPDASGEASEEASGDASDDLLAPMTFPDDAKIVSATMYSVYTKSPSSLQDAVMKVTLYWDLTNGEVYDIRFLQPMLPWDDNGVSMGWACVTDEALLGKLAAADALVEVQDGVFYAKYLQIGGIVWTGAVGSDPAADVAVVYSAEIGGKPVTLGEYVRSQEGGKWYVDAASSDVYFLTADKPADSAEAADVAETYRITYKENNGHGVYFWMSDILFPGNMEAIKEFVKENGFDYGYYADGGIWKNADGYWETVDAVSGATLDETPSYLDVLKTLYNEIMAGHYVEEN